MHAACTVMQHFVQISEDDGAREDEGRRAEARPEGARRRIPTYSCFEYAGDAAWVLMGSSWGTYRRLCDPSLGLELGPGLGLAPVS